MPNEEIEELKNCFIKALNPLKIYLFGSFANGTATKDSDFDFYIVVDNNTKDLIDTTGKAYVSVSKVQKRPIDIIVGTPNKFNSRKNLPTVEKEVDIKGKLIYESNS